MLRFLKRFFRDMPVVVVGPFRAPGMASVLDFAIAAGPVLLELRQPPPGYDRAAAEALALAALAGPVGPRPFLFTTDPAAAGHPLTRLILTWNPAMNLTADELAQGRLRTLENAASPSLLAVLADGEKVLASAQGRVGGQAETVLARLIAQTTQQVFNPLHATGR